MNFFKVPNVTPELQIEDRIPAPTNISVICTNYKQRNIDAVEIFSELPHII